MFCNKCGVEMATGVQFCGACGQPVGVANIPRAAHRVAEHHKVLGVLWMVYTGLHMMVGFLALVFVNFILTLVAHDPSSGEIPGFVRPLVTLIILFVTALAAIGIVAGWGLMKKLPWARVLTIVLSFLVVLNIPFGTALGIYSLWVLLPEESGKEYKSLAGTA